MNKLNTSKMLNNIRKTISKRSPEILTGIGITAMITSTILAVKATPKAMELVEGKKEELNKEKLTPVEVVGAAWKPYVPTSLSLIFGAACIVGAQSVNAKRNAAIATAYKLSEEAFSLYKQKVIETVGEKKEIAIADKVSEERVKNIKPDAQIIITDAGTSQFLDSVSGRLFESDMETIKRAVNEINRTMTYDMYVSLSEFYDEIGLKHTNVSDDLGWNLDRGLVEIKFSAQIADNGKPCIVLDYNVEPRYDFSKLM